MASSVKIHGFPDGLASVIKIAHHGSPNGDHPDVWASIVVKQDPIAVLTAYTPGKTGRPSVEDIDRLKSRTKHVYYTSLPKTTALKYSPTVIKSISGSVRSRKALVKNPGHVCVRWNATQGDSVQYFGAAGLA